MEEEHQLHLKERFKQYLEAVSRHTRTDALVDFMFNKVAKVKTTSPCEPTLPEMEWIKTEHGYVNQNEIEYAEPRSFPVHEFYRE